MTAEQFVIILDLLERGLGMAANLSQVMLMGIFLITRSQSVADV